MCIATVCCLLLVAIVNYFVNFMLSELYPTPVFNPTCQALEQLAATSGTCTTSDQCTGLNCVVIGIGSVDFRIEPCHNPPAVHVVGKDASGIVIVNETLTKSRQESFGLGTLNINIMQSPNEDSISISVSQSLHVYLY